MSNLKWAVFNLSGAMTLFFAGALTIVATKDPSNWHQLLILPFYIYGGFAVGFSCSKLHRG